MRVHANVYACDCFCCFNECVVKEKKVSGFATTTTARKKKKTKKKIFKAAARVVRKTHQNLNRNSRELLKKRVPKIVPEHVVPFFNSIVTVSLFNFWRNLTSFIVRVLYCLFS